MLRYTQVNERPDSFPVYLLDQHLSGYIWLAASHSNLCNRGPDFVAAIGDLLS